MITYHSITPLLLNNRDMREIALIIDSLHTGERELNRGSRFAKVPSSGDFWYNI